VIILEKMIKDQQISSRVLQQPCVDSEHIVSGAVDGTHLSQDAKDTVLRSKYKALFNLVSSFTSSAAASDTVTNEIFSNAYTKTVGGGASKLGVIDTTPYNRCPIRESASGESSKDATGKEVFGRLTSTVTALTGTLTFVNGNTAVTGSGTLFTTELAVGDYIRLDADDVFYKVASITDDLNLTLETPYANTGGSGSGSKAVFTLS